MFDQTFYNIEFWKYLSIPVVAALVGWSTNWVAVKLTFYPLEPFGWPPFFGWQGIIPSKAAKMGAITSDTTLAKLGTLKELFGSMEPETIADYLNQIISPKIEAYVEWVMLEESPEVWKIIPGFIKEMIYENVRQKLPETIREMMIDISEHIEEMVDIKTVVVKQLTREKWIVNKIFLECGEVEFRFIIRSGIYFGLLFGIIQMLVWLFFPQGWVLPVFGLIVGFATNWIAIRIIFQPLNPIKVGKYIIQGIFLKRQKEVAAVWCDIVAREIITLGNIVNEMLVGEKSRATDNVIRKHIRKVVEEMAGLAKPVVTFTVGSTTFSHIKDAASEKAVLFTASAFEDPAFNDNRATIVKAMMQERMEQLTPEEFQYLLRPAFQEDELKLILLGALLGFLAGMAQLYFIFG